MEADKLIKIWMPISKKDDGHFSAILTDTSLDRDDELMSESVMDQLSQKLSLPALADHDNSMGSWVGTFKNLQKVHNGAHYAVTGEPTFFSKEANPKAAQIKKQIEEASEMGGTCGISIGAKPKSSETVEKDGKQYKQWTDIEVMEATFTPVQSNRNSYTYVAKSFGLDKEEIKMEDKKEIKKKPDEGEPEVPKEEAPKVEEPKVEEKKEEPKAEEKPAEEKEPEKAAEIDVQKLINDGIKKAMDKMPKLKAIQETVTEDVAPANTMGFIESQIAKRYNFKEEK